jgi:hypothetical protein
MSAADAMKAAGQHTRAALKLAIVMQGRWDREHVALLTADVQQCRAACDAIEASLRGDTAMGDALLAVEEAQRQIARERLREAIGETARRHGWRAP